MSDNYIPRKQAYYGEAVLPYLKEKFNLSNVMQVPRLEKICVNKGVGRAVGNKKEIEEALDELSSITGQRAIVAYSKKDISNFKLRKGYPIGVKVTLRKKIMYDFLDRLISISLPRVRDFQGLKTSSFDGRGNYTLGIKEQIIFPEVSVVGAMTKMSGLDITFVTSTNDDKMALELLKKFGMPFKQI